MTATQKRASFILIPWAAWQLIWMGSYFFFAGCRFSVGETAAVLAADGGNVQVRLVTNPAGWATWYEAELRPASPNEGIMYAGGESSVGGFAFAWDLPARLPPRARYSLVGCPCWFVSVVLLYVSVWAVGMTRPKAAGPPTPGGVEATGPIGRGP